MIAATNSRVNLAGAQNRTNQAMGSEKKLDGEKVEVHMQPIQDSGQVSQGDSDSFRAKHLRVSGCGSCLTVPSGSLQSQRCPAAMCSSKASKV